MGLDAESRDSQVPGQAIGGWTRLFLDPGARGLKSRVEPEERELTQARATIGELGIAVSLSYAGEAARYGVSERYNRDWPIERLGHRTPAQARVAAPVRRPSWTSPPRSGMIGAACQRDRPRCAKPAVTEDTLHPIDAPGDNFKFLVVGAGRGGTSLLAGLLDYHSELEVGFELFSVPNLLGKELRTQDAEIFHERVTAFVSACRQEAARYPKAQWGNKITTEQLGGLEDHNVANPQSKVEVLDAFFNDYLKHVKVIFVLRDGRACVNSKVRRTGQPIMTACERWRYSVKCYKFLRNRHANNVCVRFEDLLLHPQTVLTRICGFLGIDYEQTMLDGVRNPKMLPEYQGEKLDTAKAEPVALPDNWFSMIEEDLKYCGYI